MRFLFGSVLSIDNAALLLVLGITCVSLFVLALIWRPLGAEFVDPGFLRSVSRAAGPAHVGLLVLVVLNFVDGFQALGTLLGVGIMMLPAITSRFWSSDVTGMMAGAVVTAGVAGYAGLLFSS